MTYIAKQGQTQIKTKIIGNKSNENVSKNTKNTLRGKARNRTLEQDVGERKLTTVTAKETITAPRYRENGKIIVRIARTDQQTEEGNQDFLGKVVQKT